MAEREWTTEVPVEPGWYWVASHTETPGLDRREVVEVRFDDSGELEAWKVGDSEPWEWPSVDLWGPRLTPPPPPTEEPTR